MIVAVLGCNGVVGAIVTVSVALPFPLAGETVIQGALLVAVHSASGTADRTAMVSTVPPSGADNDAGATVKFGAAPACVTAIVCPPAVTVAVRGEADA